MLLTGPGGTRVHGAYGPGIAGRSIARQRFDSWLLQEALSAGAQFEDGVSIRNVVVRHGRVGGVVAGSNRSPQTAADPPLPSAGDCRNNRNGPADGRSADTSPA
jgi:flavin-dependent dehydrogenase